MSVTEIRDQTTKKINEILHYNHSKRPDIRKIAEILVEKWLPMQIKTWEMFHENPYNNLDYVHCFYLPIETDKIKNFTVFPENIKNVIKKLSLEYTIKQRVLDGLYQTVCETIRKKLDEYAKIQTKWLGDYELIYSVKAKWNKTLVWNKNKFNGIRMKLKIQDTESLYVDLETGVAIHKNCVHCVHCVHCVIL